MLQRMLLGVRCLGFEQQRVAGAGLETNIIGMEQHAFVPSETPPKTKTHTTH